MALDGYKNFAWGTVAVAPSPATSGLTLTLGTGEGANLPTPPFNATIWPTGNDASKANAEIARVSGVAGDVVTFSARAQESSTARAIAVGDRFGATITAKMLTDLVNASNLASGTIPDARMPSPNLTITGTTDSRVLLATTANAAGSRNFGLANIGGTLLYIAAFVDDFSTAVNAGLRVDRLGTIQVAGDVYEKNRPISMGQWAAIAYAAGNFTSSAGSWTVDAGDQITYTYMLVGKTLWLSFHLTATSVSGTPTELRMALPSGVTVAQQATQPFSFVDGAVAGTGCAAVVVGDTILRLRKDPFGVGTWPNSTNTTLVSGTVPLAIT